MVAVFLLLWYNEESEYRVVAVFLLVCEDLLICRALATLRDDLSFAQHF